jgi:DNA-binding MarR family transcriptional regulator/GNAT superfamily N-acetyltransferase
MTKSTERKRRVAAVRRFNRFYTRQIGVLRKTFLDSPYSLSEARVLYEIASGAPTASAIGRALDLDAGYLSRVLRNFEKRGLIQRRVSATDARQSHLALSPRGRKSFAPLNRRSERDTEAMLGRLGRAQQAQLIAAMNAIEMLLGGEASTPPARARRYRLRAPIPGDFGWIVRRNAELYAQEYRWRSPFEGVCAQIVADFVNNYDPKRERCWIAEMDGENVGTVMLVKDKPGVARLRLLLVDPKARGLGLGAQLVDECIRFARRAGYKKVTLWTHSVLTAARHIYEKAGFKLMRSEPHKSWGRPVVSEHWDLEL